MPNERLPFSAYLRPDLPEDRTLREMYRIRELTPDPDIGFFGKVYNAFAGETVTGELYREMTGPDYAATGYVPTQEDIDQYASDLDPRIASRVAAGVGSFPEFLYETDQARLTMKRRQELFSGGALGTAEGFGLMLLAAGGEAMALTMLLGALGPGGAAAGAGIAATRVHRIKGMFKAMGIATAIDVPLETTRFHLDKTLRPADLLIAIGASATLSGAIGAWKPHLFLSEVQKASNIAKLRETAEAARAIGDNAAADAIEASIKQRIKAVPFDDDFDEVMGLSSKDLFAEAKARGVETHAPSKKSRSGKAPRSKDDIREDIIESRRKDTVTPEQVERQTLRDIDAMSPAARKRTARDLGVPESVVKRGGKRLVTAIVRARKKAAEVGHVTVDKTPKLPKGVSKSLRSSTSVKKVKVTFATRLEKTLWAIAKGRSRETKHILIKWFKENGVENPEKLANEFADEVLRRARAAKEGTIVADSRSMTLPSAIRRTTEAGEFTPGKGESIFATRRRVDVEVDEDIAGRIPKSHEESGHHPVGDEPDVVIMANGKPVAVGPANMVRVDAEELAGDTGRYALFGHGEGLRDTIARGIDLFPGDVPGLRHIFRFSTTLFHRLARYHSPLVREWNAAFNQNPRGGHANLETIILINTERHKTILMKVMNKAKEEAREAGFKLEDLDIVRTLRSGEDGTGPMATAVKALRKFYADMRSYAVEGKVFTDAIPESKNYFTRAYNTRKFVTLVEELGEDNVTAMFARAIMKHENSIEAGLTLSKATSIAKRIVTYGTDPQGARDWRGTQVLMERIRKELLKDGIDEREIDEFMEVIIPKIDHQPHISYGRRRIDLDETHVEVIGGREVHLDEFFNNNIRQSTARYAQRVIGGVEVRKGLLRVFGREDISSEDAILALRKDARANGASNYDVEFIGEVFDLQYKRMTGQPIYTNARMMNWIMGANAMGQGTIGMVLGLAQIPEIASIFARTGFKASLQQFPSLEEIGRIFTMGPRDLLTGRQNLGLAKLKDDMTSVLETFTGVAGDYPRGDHFMRRMDEMGFDEDYLSHGALKYLEYGRQTAALVPTGIMPMDTFLRRWAVRSSFQHFVNTAYKQGADGRITLSKGFWNNSAVRFKQLGMSEDDINRLAVSLRDPEIVTTRAGLFGRHTVKDIDLTKVKDQYIFDKFAIALRRHTDHMVQRQSFSESPFWVNHPAGKLLAQYRVFMLASKSKQLAAGVARGDVAEGVNVVGSAGLGTLAYILQSHLRAAGMNEHERRVYLEKRFGQDQLIKAGILKGSYSTIFPMLIDSGAWMFGHEPVFDPSMRTTGLAVDPFKGSVIYDIVYNKGYKATREITGALFRDDTMSKSDVRNIQSLIWLTKIPGLEQTISRLFIDKLNIPKKD